uniref:Uncharacterized protein n=1 Tax=Paramormyrops kingsleyae TaxID=1676925 RepID=A0A3B3QI95_9TELE
MVSALTSNLQALDLGEITHCLRLCSKILSKVQPPLVSPVTGAPRPPTSTRDKEDKRGCAVTEAPPSVPQSLAPEVFEDENASSSRSSESGFTDFIQYQAERSDDPVALETGSPSRVGHDGTGSAQNQPQDTPVMQGCLECFQQFLTRLVKLYIVPEVKLEQLGQDELGQEGALQSGGPANPGAQPRLEAFSAACQLFLECSSFPVYIAEGNMKSSPSWEEHSAGEHAQLPLWLQTLMDACYFGGDFSIQAVAISLVMDLVGLTQSVAMVTAESVGGPDVTQPMSPSQGRVAVVIRPPLTQGILKFLAEKTDFFKRVALILWEQLGEGSPQHHQRSVELFYQLHNLVPSASICEDVISQQLMHRDKVT